jgi:RNA polymerase sigma factor (sigma-70 family)
MSDDLRTIEAARSGDTQAFGTLVAPRLDRLYGTARVVLRDADAAEDAVQDALMRAWRDLPNLREPDRLDAWLRRLLVRACIDEARRRRRWAMAPRVPWLSESTVDLPRIEERERLDRAFERLSPDHRLALTLRFYLDMEIAEIAATTGVAVGTAKSRLHYATDALRAALEADARADAAAITETVR